MHIINLYPDNGISQMEKGTNVKVAAKPDKVIAINHRKGSYSDRWLNYCKMHKIKHKLVNCYDSNILSKLKGCDGLLWHWSHEDYRAQNFARQLTFSVEKAGIKVFPNYNSCWHFDDKLGQKYLLESINAPLVPTYVFYDKDEALNWAEDTAYPKVFKLRGGAGSMNVKKVNSARQAKKLIRIAFQNGFPLINKKSGINQRLWILKRDKNLISLLHFVKGIIRLVLPKKGLNLLPKQMGYIYFQDFVQNNEYDDRIVVIGERAIAVRRWNRFKDFKASGSGIIEHNPKIFNMSAVKIAFNIAKTIGSQSLAFDFLYTDDAPKITEISYAYAMGNAYDKCPGYWDANLNWHDDKVDPQRYIIEDFLKTI